MKYAVTNDDKHVIAFLSSDHHIISLFGSNPFALTLIVKNTITIANKTIKKKIDT